MLKREVQLRILVRKAVVTVLTNVVEVEVSVVVEFVHARKANVASMRLVHNLRDSVIGTGSASLSSTKRRKRLKRKQANLEPNNPLHPLQPRHQPIITIQKRILQERLHVHFLSVPIHQDISARTSPRPKTGYSSYCKPIFDTPQATFLDRLPLRVP